MFVSGGIFLFRLVSNRSFTSGIGPGFKNPWSSPWEKQEILLSLILYMIETHDDDRPEGPQFLSTQNTHTCYDKPYKVSLAHKTRPTNPRHTKK